MEEEKIAVNPRDRIRESISGGVFVIRDMKPCMKRKRVIEKFDRTFYKWVIAETKDETVPVTELGWTRELKFYVVWKKRLLNAESPEQEETGFQYWKRLLTITVREDHPLVYLKFEGSTPIMRDSWGFDSTFGTQAIPLKREKNVPLKWVEGRWTKITPEQLLKLELPVVYVKGVQKIKGETVYQV